MPADVVLAAPALAAGLPCENLSPLLQSVCRTAQVVDRVGPLPAVGSVTPSGIVDGLGDSAMRGMTGFVVEGAAWLLAQVAKVVTDSTQVRVRAGWFMDHYDVMATIAASFAVLFLLLSAASTLVHQDPARLGRAVAMVAAAGVGTGAVVVVTDMLLTISDQLSAAVAQGMAGDLKQSLDGAARGLSSMAATTAGAQQTPLFPALLVAVLVAVAAVVIWVELLLREVAIYAVVLFFPLALAGLVWDASRAWARRLAEMLAALIFSKFVIVAILSLASGGLASGSEGFGGVLAGGCMLLVAAFAPFVLMRVIGVLEVAAAANALEGTRQRGGRPVAQGGQAALRAVQRHRSARTAALTVAGAGGAFAAVPHAANAVRPRAPLPRADRRDNPPMAKGA